MMTVIRFLSEPFWQQLGLTLIHFLWQGLAMALVVAGAVRLFRLGHGQRRYAAYLLAFALMAACPLLTFMALGRPAETEAAPAEPASAVDASPATGISEGPSAGETVIAPGSAVETARAEATPAPAANRLQEWLPWAVGFWMLGVTVLSLRLLLGYIGIQRWRRCVQPLPQDLTQRVGRLAQSLGLPKFSRIFLCPAISEATAVGYLRPMVLLPVAMLTRMDPAMIEAVVAHELAHIRRLDLWVNLAQRIVETLLFYHPAVWWLSNRLRAEREFCCDEMAVQATGERLTYATALETAQRGRLAAAQPDLALALGRGKKSTLSRVRHILGLPPTPSDSRFWLAGAIAVVILVILAMPTASLMSARADAEIAEDSETVMPRLFEAAEAGDIERVKALLANGADVNTHDRANRTALHYAAERGHLEVVRLLLARGADVNAGAQAGWTPLLVATANKGRAQITELLLKNQARVNDADTAGYTALFYAIWADDEETVKTLIAYGADVNKTPKGDYSPLVYGVWQWHTGNVKALMNAGADINVKDGDGWTPLYWAVDEGAPEVIRLLIDAGVQMSDIHRAVLEGNLEQVKKLVDSGTAVDTRDEVGRPLTHWALAAGQLEVFDYLLNEGADITIATKQGSTLLHKASEKGLTDVIRRLIAKGAAVNARTNRGETALFAAARRGHKEVCQLLVANGADVNAALKNGRHPLGDATLRGHEEVVKLLLANGADVNLSVNNYGVALQAAACYGHPALVDILIAAGADVNANTRNGTPLHLAARAGKRIDDETVGQIVKKLLEHGADVHAIDKQSGCTPLHIASQKGRAEMARLLIAAGAEVNAKDNQGRTPLSYAEGRYECRKVAELLRAHGATEETSAVSNDQKPAKSLHDAAAGGDIERVKSLLAAGADVNGKQDETGRTAPHCAVEAGHRNMAELLIAKGADVNARTTDKGWTPLVCAVNERHAELVKLLLDEGADSAGKTDDGCAFLHQASRAGYLGIVKRLIAMGAEVNATYNKGRCALGDAALNGHKDVVELLLAKGVDVNLQEAGRGTALHAAARTGRTAIVDLLIAHGADVNLSAQNGTPLHRAVSCTPQVDENTCAEIVDKLIDAGADVNAKEPRPGDTPLHIAARKRHLQAAARLIRAGADPGAKNKDGKTPIDLAREQGYTKVIQPLRAHEV
jgi:ankyrin repeat protein/beta-lactamase regulating signal transducer with metallopeptidase domain